MKKALYEKAWPEHMRDMRYFYDEVTKGLTNELMKSQLWSFEPRDAEDYERKMRYLASVVQKRYRAREISEAQALGAETSVQGYTVTNSKPFIKQEPGVHAMAEENAVCFHCRKKGHFARNCPRKLAGLTPPAAAVEEQVEEGVDEVDETDADKEDEEINFIRNNRAFRGRPYRLNNRFKRSNNQNRPMTNRRPQLSRVGVLYMDENGEQYVQDEETDTKTPQTPQDASDPIDEPIHTVQLDEMFDHEDHTEAEFTAYPFLGVAASSNQN